MYLTLTKPKTTIAHSRFELEPKLDMDLLTAANRMKQKATAYLLANPNRPVNWYEIQGWLEVELQQVKNQVCQQNAFMSFQELEDLAWKSYMLSVLAKELLSTSNALAS